MVKRGFRSSVSEFLHKNKIAFGLWGLTSALAGITGPFGTYEALGPVALLVYWAVISGVSVGSSVWVGHQRGKMSFGKYAAFRTVNLLGLALFIMGLNQLVFDNWVSIGTFSYLLALVAGVSLIVEAGIWLLNRPDTAPSSSSDAPSGGLEDKFLKLLPFDKRGPLVRIEAQDHYLNVTTQRGSTLILLRMADAVEALAGANGLRVHRSHWVALDGVVRHHRRNGRDFVEMNDGVDVPISRGYRDAAKAAGLMVDRLVTEA